MVKHDPECGVTHTEIQTHDVVVVDNFQYPVTRFHVCNRKHAGDVIEEKNPDLRKHQCGICMFRWTTGGK
jgi:hypothetical protein